jgi:hypothetical protein
MPKKPTRPSSPSQPPPPDGDLFASGPVNDAARRSALTPIMGRMLDAAETIAGGQPPDRVDYLHSVLCQVGLPRSRVDTGTFERTSGAVSLLIEAGKLWNGREWVKQSLPYGTRPRLALVHVSSEAIRTKSRVIEIGSSVRDFLLTLGADTGGHEYGRFQSQMRALAACEMRLGIGHSTVKAQPIEQFEAWLHATGQQATLWPGTLTLSQRFYETLGELAVPMDPRALAALRHSALALDTYTWLAHRLHRVRQSGGTKLSWSNLKDQFGQEYGNPKDFKREMTKALRAVSAVYPDAHVEDVPGGVLLRPSPPPIPKALVTVRKSEG